MEGRGTMLQVSPGQHALPAQGAPSPLVLARETSIICAARTQRDCIRYIKQYAEFESQRMDALLTTTDLPNSNTWWMLKQHFHSFVEQQVMMKNPDDFHDAHNIFQLLERSCSHWATHHNDETARRQMGMFSKLLRTSKIPYTPRQESLWLYLSNQLHTYFKFALDDSKTHLPLSLVPTAKAQRALKRALLATANNKLADAESSWRKLPEELVDAAVDKIYRSSSEHEGHHVMRIEIFTFIDITIECMSKYENEIKHALVHLSNVASGVDELDSVSWSEFNVIIDIAEPTLPSSMRLTLFHRFSQAAVLKEGKKWESQALADTLLHYALPMDNLNVVYISQAKNIKAILEAECDAVVTSANAAIEVVLQGHMEEDEMGAVVELEKRVLQVKGLTSDAMAAKVKDKYEAAYLSCLFLAKETEKIIDFTQGAAHMPDSWGGTNSRATKFEEHFNIKSKFQAWKKIVEDTRSPHKTKSTHSAAGA